jgi:hypothetical protein
MNRNLTATQSDYAKFLPATSTFYSTFVGKQRHFNYVDPNRIPASFPHGAESLNYLDPDKGAFYYHWCLYSAGHANLDLAKIETPNLPDRQKWVERLAMFHWNFDEIERLIPF